MTAPAPENEIFIKALSTLPEDKLRLLHAFLAEFGMSVDLRLIAWAERKNVPESKGLPQEDFLPLVYEKTTDSKQAFPLCESALVVRELFAQSARGEIQEYMWEDLYHHRFTEESFTQMMHFIGRVTGLHQLKKGAVAPESYAGRDHDFRVKDQFIDKLKPLRRSWYLNHFKTEAQIERIAALETDYAFAVKASAHPDNAMQPEFALMEAFERLRLYHAYNEAGLGSAQIRSAINKLESVFRTISPTHGDGRAQ